MTPMFDNLPTLNASLNGTSAIFIIAGYLAIWKKKVTAHAACMLAATIVSACFLISYVIYHVKVGSVRFPGQGWVRPLYFGILISHTTLALAIVPLILRTLYLAAKREFERHTRIARWTLPLWLYVSVTGVIVYWMLYQIRWTPPAL
ncbi:MAG: DUF420 domain-containing protein [Elusimicrobia bacterium]|nr:DUF420 domain-containing protein [Elusimicrobiota bacterium]